MKRLFVSLTACFAFALHAPAVAATYQLDGQLPMYPKGTLDVKESSLTPDAIAHGVPLVLLTTAAVHDVDAWYGAKLPKSCTRQEASGGIKYACPTGSVMIYDHGGTQIALIPPFPKL